MTVFGCMVESCKGSKFASKCFFSRSPRPLLGCDSVSCFELCLRRWTFRVSRFLFPSILIVSDVVRMSISQGRHVRKFAQNCVYGSRVCGVCNINLLTPRQPFIAHSRRLIHKDSMIRDSLFFSCRESRFGSGRDDGLCCVLADRRIVFRVVPMTSAAILNFITLTCHSTPPELSTFVLPVSNCHDTFPTLHRSSCRSSQTDRGRHTDGEGLRSADELCLEALCWLLCESLQRNQFYWRPHNHARSGK